MNSNQGKSSQEQKNEIPITITENVKAWLKEFENPRPDLGDKDPRDINIKKEHREMFLLGKINGIAFGKKRGNIEYAQEAEDFLIYLFRNKKIDWDTKISLGNNVISAAVKENAYRLVDELLQSMQQRKITTEDIYFDSYITSPEMWQLLTKEYGLKVDINYIHQKSDEFRDWPRGSLTLLQSYALQGNTDAVLKLLNECKADPNVNAAPGIRMCGGYIETVLTKMMITMMKANRAYPQDLLEKQIHIVKLLAAYGLEVTAYDLHYIRNIQGDDKTENGERYEGYILPMAFHKLPSKNRETLSKIFEQMMNAYNEGRKAYIEQTKRDASLTVPNLGLIDVHKLFSGATPGVTNIINEYAADSNPNVIAADAEMAAKNTFDYKERVKAEEKDKVEKINREAMLEGKLPDLSQLSSLFSGGSSPLTNIIKDYDQGNRTDQLTRDFGKDEKKGEKKGADVKDKEEENLDKDKGKGQQP